MVVNELRGEKIDIVPFSEDFQDFVAKALSPAKVSQVIVSDDGTQSDVIVPDHQLSLAIGREGQNARLAARLTGVRIDIRSETQLAEGIPARRDELDEGVEYAEGQWVTNSATGELEWHAADGTIISESEWNAQQRRDRARRRRRLEEQAPREAPATRRSRASRRRARPSSTSSEAASASDEPAEHGSRRPREAPATRRSRASRASERQARRAGRSALATSRTRAKRAISAVMRPERTCVGCRRRRPQSELVRCALAGRRSGDRQPDSGRPWSVAVPSTGGLLRAGDAPQGLRNERGGDRSNPSRWPHSAPAGAQLGWQDMTRKVE